MRAKEQQKLWRSEPENAQSRSPGLLMELRTGFGDPAQMSWLPTVTLAKRLSLGALDANA